DGIRDRNVTGVQTCALPIFGGELLADHAAVLTLATLALGGTFDATARSVGLSDGGYRSELVSSPFDYAKQGILYTATGLPRPGREGTDEQLLVEMTELRSEERR